MRKSEDHGVTLLHNNNPSVCEDSIDIPINTTLKNDHSSFAVQRSKSNSIIRLKLNYECSKNENYC